MDNLSRRGAFFSSNKEVSALLDTLLAGHVLENHPDFYVLSRQESKQSIGLNEVREALAWWQQSPWLRDAKFIWFQEAHLLTEEAQTALLKPVEEPYWPSMIYFTGELDDLLPALRSRLEVLSLGQSDPPDVSCVLGQNTPLRQKLKLLEGLQEQYNGLLILRGLLKATRHSPKAVTLLRDVRYTHKASLRKVVLELHHLQLA